MKKLALLINFLFYLGVYGQKNNGFILAEITTADQKIFNAYIDKIYIPKNGDYVGMESEKNDKRWNKKYFEYKINDQDQPQKIFLSEIKKIIVKDKMDDKIIGYEFMKAHSIDYNGKIVDNNYSVLLPIVREGKINMYSYDLNLCQNNACIFMLPTLAFKKPNDEYVLYLRLGTEYFFTTLMNALAEIGKDCPYFVNYINEIRKTVESKEFKKKFRKDFKNRRKQKYEEIKSQYKKYEINEILDNDERQFYFDYVYGFLNEYDKNCP